jgi:hypothetical protein
VVKQKRFFFTEEETVERSRVVVAANEIEVLFTSGVEGRGCVIWGFGAGEVVLVSAVDCIVLDGFDGVFHGVVAGITLSAGLARPAILTGKISRSCGVSTFSKRKEENKLNGTTQRYVP